MVDSHTVHISTVLLRGRYSQVTPYTVVSNFQDGKVYRCGLHYSSRGEMQQEMLVTLWELYKD